MKFLFLLGFLKLQIRFEMLLNEKSIDGSYFNIYLYSVQNVQ